MPRLIDETGMTTDSLQISEGVWKSLARASGYDPGIRSVERKVESIVRNTALKTVKGEGPKFVVTEQNMKEFVEG